MFSSDKWFGASESSFYSGVVQQSLRLNEGAYLSKAYGSSPTSSTTMSFGGWLKLNRINYANVFSATLGGSGVPQSFFAINDDEKLLFQSWTGSSNIFHYITTQRFRDHGAWYHFWFQIDTNDTDAGSRVKIYVNGVRVTAFDTEVDVSTQGETVIGFNQNYTHYFGHSNGTYGVGAYFADWWFLDGQDVSPIDTVGEFKEGIFIPKEYTSATFGNKGWHLEFKQTGGSADASGIGADTSGSNTNHWSVNGVDAHDSNMPDCPENNFPVFNRNLKTNSGTLQEGCLKNYAFGGGSSSYTFIGSTFGVFSGKWYIEMLINNELTPTSSYCGVMLNRNNDANRYGREIAIPYDGNIVVDGSYVQTGLSAVSGGDIFGFIVDVDNKTAQVYRNGSTYGTQIDWSSHTFKDEAFIGIGCFGAGSVTTTTVTVNYGQDASFAGVLTGGDVGTETDANGIGKFKYSVPTGYLALCNSNLSNTITASEHFNTRIYAGLGTSTQNVENIGFEPDWTWIKNRSDGYGHQLQDSTRGMIATKILSSNQTEGENTASATGDNYGHISDTGTANGGFFTVTHTINANDDGGTIRKGTHFSGNNYVSWNWKANGGVTSTNNDGSLQSTVQANTTAGFSIVTYTGDSTGNNGTARTVGHGLNAVPKFIWTLPRDSNDGAVYHVGNTSAPETDRLVFKSDSSNNLGTSDDAGFWNDTAPTSSVFSIGTRKHTNSNGGMVAYCFAEIEGYSRIGSYVAYSSGTGTPNHDGNFIYTGFRPAWIMLKRSDSTGNWNIHDNKRATFNPMQNFMLGTAVAEQTSEAIDFLSNGVKLRSASGYFAHPTGGEFIFVAFAENPFKNTLAR